MKPRFNHCMLDLETMGTEPGCPIVSIGAVMFNLETGEPGTKFFQAINLESSMRKGFAPSAPTILWWLDQDKEIIKKLTEKTKDFDDVIESFWDWLGYEQPEFMWGNDPQFDCSVLRHAFKVHGLEPIWSFRSERSFRTIRSLDERVYEELSKARVNAHDPIQDCLFQIDVVAKTIQSFKKDHWQLDPNCEGSYAFNMTNRVIQLEEALSGILDIGKRDMTNPKYDTYFNSAKEALRK